MFSIFTILPEVPPIRVVDIGAMFLNGKPEAYAPLIEAGACTVMGFEPIESERRILEEKYPGFTFLPHLVADGGVRSFHITNTRMTSSIYPPNQELLEAFDNFSSLVQVERVEKLPTVTLDSAAEEFSPDFLKCDAQGAEMDIFSHAVKTLAQTVVVQTEVLFVEHYLGNAMFADIDAFLRSHGFQFYRFVDLEGRSMRNPLAGTAPAEAAHQMWADAIYVKDMLRLERLNDKKLLAMAAILHEVLQAYDFCWTALDAYDRRTGREGPACLAPVYEKAVLAERGRP